MSGRADNKSRRSGSPGPLVQALMRWRQELSIPHKRFAHDVLRVSQPYWVQLRHGIRDPGKELISRVLRLRPELQYWVVEELRREPSDATEAA